MSEKILTPDEQHRVAAVAQKRGFRSIRDYMRALIEQDAAQHGESAPLEDEPSPGEIRESVKQGLREAFRGEFLPLETLWSKDDE